MRVLSLNTNDTVRPHRESPPDCAGPPKMLNVGCGRQFHPEWENIDLESVSPHVKPHDVTNGLPYASDSLDVVYHSHILEHLKPEKGRELIDECFRVLRPGGVLRIVVPDLERIANLYLRMHDKAWKGDERAEIHYRWMKLELLDQLVRETSGGQMGRYMASDEIKNSAFVHARVGHEYWICRSIDEHESSGQRRWWQQIKSTWWHFRERAALLGVRLLMGTKAVQAFREGLFRSRGEVHRWMYDRFSLKSLCRDAGFEQFKVCQADESSIHDFDRFELDSVEGQIRKPDSLFVECTKPDVSVEAGLPALKRAA